MDDAENFAAWPVGASSACQDHRSLVVRAAHHTCALNLAHVIEVMRPLPVKPLAGAPKMVLGLSVIRGSPVLVVSLAALFNAESEPCARFVLVRAGGRRVALAASAVLGIREFSPSIYQALPPLLQDTDPGAVHKLVVSDSELLLVLDTARILSAELANSLAGQEC